MEDANRKGVGEEKLVNRSAGAEGWRRRRVCSRSLDPSLSSPGRRRRRDRRRADGKDDPPWTSSSARSSASGRLDVWDGGIRIAAAALYHHHHHHHSRRRHHYSARNRHRRRRRVWRDGGSCAPAYCYLCSRAIARWSFSHHLAAAWCVVLRHNILVCIPRGIYPTGEKRHWHFAPFNPVSSDRPAHRHETLCKQPRVPGILQYTILNNNSVSIICYAINII